MRYNHMKQFKFKKVLSLTVAAAISMSMLAGCATKGKESDSVNEPTGTPTPVAKTNVNIATLKGPTGMGMAKLMEDNQKGSTANNYNFSIAGAPEEIVAKITTGEVDVAAVPTNLAATLFNKTQGKVQIAAINTLGVLYVVQRNDSKSGEIKNISDLKGKTLYITGQGSTPEFALEYILSQNGIDPKKDIKIEYKTEHSELATLLSTGQVDIAMLPEPFVTQVTGDGKVAVKIDIAKEWEKVANNTPLAMGAIIVRKDFVDKNKAAVDKLMEEYKASANYTNSNIDDSAKLIAKFDIMPEAVAKKAIPKCNIVFKDGEEMKGATSKFLDILAKADIKSVGGKLPDEGFYYKK